MTSPRPADASQETDHHDFEAGRQLAWVAAVGTVLVGSVVAWLGLWMTATVGVLFAGIAVAVVGFVRPVMAIRIVSGRWAELSVSHERRARPEPAAQKLQEGTPIAVVAVEDLVPQRERRARWGIAGMLGGVLLGTVGGVLVWRDLLSEDVARWVFSLAGLIGVGGLILWYRTK
jgi:hypothetical protein